VPPALSHENGNRSSFQNVFFRALDDGQSLKLSNPKFLYTFIIYVGGYMHNAVIEIHRDVVETDVWVQLHGSECAVIQVLTLLCVSSNVRVLGTIESVVVRHIGPIKGLCCILSCSHDALQDKKLLMKF
jgi:hypothetical protein